MIKRLAVLAVIAATLVMAPAACGPAPPSDSSPALSVAGYVVPWDERSTAAIGAGALGSVSPVWFQPTEAGGVAFASAEAEASVPAVAAEASARHVEVIPTVSNFRNDTWDGALVHTIISDPRQRSRHISALVDLVRSRAWPGIDLDYESLPAAGRKPFSSFVQDLAAALHAVGARLTVTVHAKIGEPGTWSGAQAQDWRALGKAADQVRVMAYDYSSAGSEPGAIAPRRWMEQVLALAVSLIPRERIVLGIGTYGYDWAPGEPGVALQWADVQDLARQWGAEERWDSAAESPWLRYTDEQGRSHTVWYENARSLSNKIDTARRLGVTRVVLWRLGGEDPGVWEALRSPG